MNNAAVAAIEYSIRHDVDEGQQFLRCWFEGDFETCRKEWPDAPDACYVGADPLHPGTEKDRVTWALQGVLEDVIAERRRQVFEEGFDTAQDDAYTSGELAGASAAYASHARWQAAFGDTGSTLRTSTAELWPWSIDWWKPSDAYRNMVKACALGLAELERLRRRDLASAQALAAPSAKAPQ